MLRLSNSRFFSALLCLLVVWDLSASAAAPATRKASAVTVRNIATRSSARFASGAPSKRSIRHRHSTTHSRYGVPTFADSTNGDIAEFDDPIVRQAAVEALGHYNGSVVAIDPNSGRVLSVVNQKLAFSDGFIPCSTIKPAIALAALEESVITRDTMVPVARRRYMNLTEAMAHSNNKVFEEVGRRMGFETVSRYAHHLGKTGTCSEQGSRLGWFVSYAADQVHPRIALVVLLRGNTHRVMGPTAALVAGRIYHRLHELNYITATRLDAAAGTPSFDNSSSRPQ